MTTLENLKENRVEIINYLTQEVGSENVKEAMIYISNMIGFRNYNNYSVMRFVEAALEDSGLRDKIIMRNGAKASAWLEIHNAESSKELKKHI